MNELVRLQEAGAAAEAAFRAAAATHNLTVVVDGCNPHAPQILDFQSAELLGLGSTAEQQIENARLLLQSCSFDFLVCCNANSGGFAFVEVKNSTSRNWIELTGPSFRVADALACFGSQPVCGFALFIRFDVNGASVFNVLSRRSADWSASFANSVPPAPASSVTQFVTQALSDIRTTDGIVPKSRTPPASKAGRCVRSNELWVYFHKQPPAPSAGPALSRVERQDALDVLHDVISRSFQAFAFYHWWCESRVPTGARSGRPSLTISNASLESSLMSIRDMDDFFEGSARSPDDVVASDFAYDASRGILSPDERTAINKKLAHLTYRAVHERRGSSSQVNPRTWNFADLINRAMAQFLPFLDHLESTFLVGEPEHQNFVRSTRALIMDSLLNLNALAAHELEFDA